MELRPARQTRPHPLIPGGSTDACEPSSVLSQNTTVNDIFSIPYTNTPVFRAVADTVAEFIEPAFLRASQSR
jgi:hypothetical protein